MSRRRQRFVRIGSFFVLAFALMPAITYMGHWPLDSGHLHEDTASTASSEDHELHCHAGLSHCAGSEAMVGSFWVGEDPDILSLTSPDRHVETHVDATALEGAPVRILQPPRAA